MSLSLSLYIYIYILLADVLSISLWIIIMLIRCIIDIVMDYYNAYNMYYRYRYGLLLVDVLSISL